MALSVMFSNPNLEKIDTLVKELTQIVTCPESALLSQYQLQSGYNHDQTLNNLLPLLVQMPEIYYFRLLNYCIPKLANEIDKDFSELFPQHPAVQAQNDELAGRNTEGVPLLDILHLATHTDVLLQSHPHQEQLFVIENAPGMAMLIETSHMYRQLMNTPQVQCFVDYLYRANIDKQKQKNGDGSWSYRYYDRCFNDFYGD
jgi:hypothetical protein